MIKTKRKSDLKKKIDLADQWFSRRIRLEASDENGLGKCICCGKVVEIKHADAGHFFSRKHYAVRWEPNNAHLQSKICNMQMGQPEVNLRYREAMIEKYGHSGILYLEIKKNNYFKLDRLKLDLIIQENKEIVNRLLKEKGIEKWW